MRGPEVYSKTPFGFDLAMKPACTLFHSEFASGVSFERGIPRIFVNNKVSPRARFILVSLVQGSQWITAQAIKL
jgi:hypothetical protein